MSRSQLSPQLLGAVFLSTIAWASAWVSIKVAGAHYTAGQLALGRYIVASLILAPIFLARRPKFRKRDWPWIFAGGVAGFTLYNLGINMGEHTITAGAAALIAATIPLFATLGAQLFLGEEVNPRSWIGGAIALAGVALIGFGSQEGIGFKAGALYVLGASVCSAAYALIQKILLSRGYASLDITAAAIFCGVVALIPFGGGLVGAIKTAPFTATANVVLLGAFPGALGYFLWAYCLSKLPVAKAMVFLYLISPLTVLMDWAFLHEFPSHITLIGGAIALTAVVGASRPATK